MRELMTEIWYRIKDGVLSGLVVWIIFGGTGNLFPNVRPVCIFIARLLSYFVIYNSLTKKYEGD